MKDRHAARGRRMAEYDLAEQLVSCRNCKEGYVLKGFLAGFFRDVVEPGWAPPLTCKLARFRSM
jgi:hypothetical protein